MEFEMNNSTTNNNLQSGSNSIILKFCFQNSQKMCQELSSVEIYKQLNATNHLMHCVLDVSNYTHTHTYKQTDFKENPSL